MPPLVESPGDLAVRKGEAADKAGYSAFEDTGLAEKLHLMDVELIGVCGIATEFCVRATAMDAAHAGFRVSVLTDLIRPVQVIAAESTLRELSALGIEPVSSTTWLANS